MRATHTLSAGRDTRAPVGRGTVQLSHGREPKLSCDWPMRSDRWRRFSRRRRSDTSRVSMPQDTHYSMATTRSELTVDDIQVGEHRSECVDRLIADNHYLDTVPSPPCIYRYLISGGMLHGIVGAAMWGKPVARMEDQENTLELLRFWTDDGLPKNTESKALGAMIRDIDDKDTHDRLIAYASTGEGHEGTIYKATNWRDEGVRETHGGDGWENRDGRTNGDDSAKRKFVYEL